MPPHLLTLPRELRDSIYSEVLNLPASSPNAKVSRRRVPRRVSLWLPRHLPPSPSTALLTSNRQIRTEFSEHISKQGTYALHIILDSGDHRRDHDEQLIPTWTRLPAVPILCAKRVYVELRPRCVVHMSGRYFNFWERWYRGPSASLLGLLKRFFAYGPTFWQKDAGMWAVKPSYIEELVLDVLPVDVEDEGDRERHLEYLTADRSSDPQDEVFEGLMGLIGGLARGGMVWGKVGRIVLMRDGVVRKEWVVEWREERWRWQWDAFGPRISTDRSLLDQSGHR